MSKKKSDNGFVDNPIFKNEKFLDIDEVEDTEDKTVDEGVDDSELMTAEEFFSQVNEEDDTEDTDESEGEWVWMLTAEDITELESDITLWRDKDKAKAAMEESIRKLTAIWDELELERDGDDYACLEDREVWSIQKIKIQD